MRCNTSYVTKLWRCSASSCLIYTCNGCSVKTTTNCSCFYYNLIQSLDANLAILFLFC
ncbi:hypothetical protein Ccrd_010461 [Cynara cardunculus var. scolymus]|uniref:Uncharacterized protein n=1 Tax=Cynara cardunculus var. scolymus TaxID=59895 RepID=A0A124SI02_CYNCS|nr:hypothetical protein Ccrd_010461 [Cynara cardunculus var. scolymus]